MPSNRQHLGYAVMFSPEGEKENDTFTCAHCNTIVHIPPKGSGHQMPGGTCGSCGFKLICDACVERGVCTPFLKQLEQIEARDRFFRAAGIG
jgi:hypothetical protein